MTDDRRRSRPAEAEVAAPLELDGVGVNSEEAMTDRIMGGPRGAGSNAPGPIERASARPPVNPDPNAVVAAGASEPPRPRLSEPVPSSRRMRAHVLRIPDDEVARPTLDIQSPGARPASKIPPAAPPDAATLPNLPYIPPDPKSVAHLGDGVPRPASGPPAASLSNAPGTPVNASGAIAPSRIISVGGSMTPRTEPPPAQAIAPTYSASRPPPPIPPQPHAAAPAPAPAPQAPYGLDSLNNDSWTPYQPKVVEGTPSEPQTRRHLSTSTLQDFVDDSEPDAMSSIPSSEEIPVDIGDDSEEPTQVVEPVSSADAERVLANLPPSGSMRAIPAAPSAPSGASLTSSPDLRNSANVPAAPRALPSSPQPVGGPPRPSQQSSPSYPNSSQQQPGVRPPAPSYNAISPSSPPPPRAPMPSSPHGLLTSTAARAPSPSYSALTGSTPPPRPPMPSSPPPPSSPPGARTSSPPAPPRPVSVPPQRAAAEVTTADPPEISSEDLVSIESVPAPPNAMGLPPMRAPSRSNPPPLEVRPPLRTDGPAAIVSPAPAAPSAPSVTGGASPAKPGSAIAPPPVDASAAAAAAAAKKRGRPWWEDLFNDDYLRTQGKITDAQVKKEADFIEESLGVQRGAMVLDLGCGTGLQAIELTRRGYQVVGFDLSLAMLAKAADEAHDRAQKINFVQGDMRDMTFENTFDGVYSWNTSFGYFDEEKNAQVIGNVQRALRKGGQFLLDVANRDYIMRQAPSLAWFEGDGCICMDEMNVDPITSRMKVKRTMMIDDGRSKEIEYSVRLYALHELGKLLHDNGFRVAEVSGRVATPGVYFGAESPRTLILAEKR